MNRGMTEEMQLALRWFKANGIPAHYDDCTSIFIKVNDIEIQIHACEISHRADLQKGIEDEYSNE
jgi:hypothetical protein